jgi:hypothetical protein
MLVFSNPGEIDIRAATIMGVNIKENSSAIGYFGTGLKYAIAGITRMGGTIEIWAGETYYSFSGKKGTIRGKEITLIEMTINKEESSTLGFTTDLGKAWKPWMLYRELYCNCVDEGGKVELLDANEKINPQAGTTTIVVKCEALYEAHRNRADFILSQDPIIKLPELEVIDLPGKIFYRGVKVLDNPSGLFSYNLLQDTKLTEDRTMEYYWTAAATVRDALQKCEDYDFITKVITSENGSFEGSLSWSWSYCGEVFKKAALDVYATRSAFLSPTLYAQIKMEKFRDAPSLPLNKMQEVMLEKAKKFLARNFQVNLTQEIIIADMGENVLGKAEQGKIYISPEAFERGTKILAGTLWEEYLHITYNYEDESRNFQNFLINKCMSLAELVQGEPI